MLQWAVHKGRGDFTVLLSKLVSIVSLSVQWLLTYKSGCTVNYKILRTSMFIHTTSTICPINHSRLTIQMLSSVCVSASPVLMTQLIWRPLLPQTEFGSFEIDHVEIFLMCGCMLIFFNVRHLINY